MGAIKAGVRKMEDEKMMIDLMRSGHMACPGCGVVIAMRLVLRALGRKTIAVIIPSCSSIIAATYPNSSLKVPAFHGTFESTAPTAAGISYVLKLQGKDDISVVAFAGDGGTFDIGLQALSSTVDRNEHYIYVCLDNEAYMNTGIQASSATPEYAWTITTPLGRSARKKNIMEIMAAHRIPYAATASIGYPQDLMEKVQFDSRKYAIIYESQGLPVDEYLHIQGRYRHLRQEQIAHMQAQINGEWENLKKKVAGSQ